ncbi:MAG TPA: carbon-nitrogen hydrolase family protein [Candidatus Hydrogenedentes bacterium]|nr:carbon-nitrogen hydrolase family protein [Candidatus Hydrogenedentota bacterium]HPG69417.1 carbon-nitrogen hydrolase family protein [Candidatus Hydrogenedentota bacterium]
MRVAVVVVLATLAMTAQGEEAVQESTPPGARVRLGLMRSVPVKWDLETNFKTWLRWLDEASAEKVELFITPEGWLDGYAAPDKASTPDRLGQVAQDPSSSPYLAKVSEEAQARRMYLCFGFTSLEDGRIYNAAGLWNDSGDLIGIYHKTHIQTHDHQYTPGEALPVWPSRWGPIGIMICADRRWPETARCLRLQGARLILNPTYGFRGDLNTAMMRTRAYENQCFIAFTHPEESLVTDPRGGVAAVAADSEGVLVCEVDLSKAKDDNHLRDRRPSLYGVLTGER